ncbi:MAG: tetracycline resistance MFS efflux pump, partial [Pseudoxanthomonas sp.]|nr:tetracycline resistance MFS efflux pump [Pseudoxanthomonas sp.]
MRRAALAFIFITVLVDVLAFGVVIPVLPPLLKQVTGGEIATGTVWHGLFATGFMLMQFFASPVQGALSDR